MDLPPPVYDYEPNRPYEVLVLPEVEVFDRCYGLTPACAIPSRSLIVISEDLQGEERERVLRHERAHINGWVHDGPICVDTRRSRCVPRLMRSIVGVKSWLLQIWN